MKRLTVLYDDTCALCVRCASFVASQRAYVEVEVLGSHTEAARARYGSVPWLGEELVVVSDTREVWAGPAAFLMCLWALEEWRPWSYRLSGAALAPLAERFFVALSSRRRKIAALLAPDPCEGGTCRLPAGHAPRTAYR
jgi:predicted DCC family thiol-disulfide oxidoreductase YuxK